MIFESSVVVSANERPTPGRAGSFVGDSDSDAIFPVRFLFEYHNDTIAQLLGLNVLMSPRDQ